MHEQNDTTFEVWTHQQHYVPQFRDTQAENAALLGDDAVPANDGTEALFMLLVGALAWAVLSTQCICVYVAPLQRQTQFSTLGHIGKANRLLR